jgi:hypothetical protein
VEFESGINETVGLKLFMKKQMGDYQSVSVLSTGLFYSVCILFFKLFAPAQSTTFIGKWLLVPVALQLPY